MSKFDSELVSGSVFRSVWKLTWPVVLTQIIAGIHGMIDQMLVGKHIGYHAQAGVGVSWQLFLVIIVFISSLFHGMGIMIARYTGRQDHDAMNRIAYQVVLACMYILAFVIAPVGYFISPTLLNLVNASPEVQQHALPYIRTLFTLSAPMFVMFVLNGAFQASGQPKIPLMLGIMTTIVHVIISYVLITGVGPFPALGAQGAAIGTCLGPLPSAIAAFALIYRHKTIIGPPTRYTLKVDFTVLKSVARIGIPSGIQAVLLNLGGAVLLSFIGSLEQSAASQAAYTICYTQLFSFVTWTGFGLRAACATLMGQNIGAGKSERGKQAVYVGAAFGFLWALGFGLLYWNASNFLLGAFSVEEQLVLTIANDLLHYLAFSGVFVAVTLAFTGGLQGAGDTKKPMMIAFVTQILVLLGVCFTYEHFGQLTTSAIWSAILVSHMSRFFLTIIAFWRGKWTHIKVEIG